MRLNRPIRTRFRYGSPSRVNLATHSQLAGSFFKRHAVTTAHPAHTGRPRLRRLVGTRFQVLFHSPPGVLFTIPSRYSSAIGHQEVFRLTRWSWPIHTRFHEPRATRGHAQGRRPATPTRLPRSTAGHSRPFGFTRRFITPRRQGSTGTHAPHNPAPATPARSTTDTV